MFTLRCKCGATGTAHGGTDFETNSVELTTDPEWEEGDPACEHNDYTVIDEYDPFEGLEE